MKPLEEIVPVIRTLYEKGLRRDPEELTSFSINHDHQSYVVHRNDNWTEIPRRFVDDYVDGFEKAKAKACILGVLNSL